jgi:hypothetical protein
VAHKINGKHNCPNSTHHFKDCPTKSKQNHKEEEKEERKKVKYNKICETGMASCSLSTKN